MARTHEVPNHLNVEDTCSLDSLHARWRPFMAFASPAYGIWDQLTIAPLPVRGALAGLMVLAGIAFTLIQPGGRSLDEWTFAVFAYTVTPRRMRWCRLEADPREWCANPSPGWVDFRATTRLGRSASRGGDRQEKLR
jgi:hypothetical protein